MESTGLGTTSRTAYLLDYNAVKTVTSDVSDNDDSFYRMDKITGARSKNDGGMAQLPYYIDIFINMQCRNVTALQISWNGKFD